MSCSVLTEDVLKTLSTQFLNPASQTCICFSLFCVFFLYTVFLLSFCLSQVQTVCVIENMHEKHVETHRLTSFSRIRQTFSHTNILPMHTYTNSRFLHNVRADGDSMPVYSWLGRTQDQVFMLPFWSCVVCIWRCSFSSAWDGAVWNIQQGAQCNYLNSRTQLLHKWAIECRGWTQQASPQRNNGSVSMCVQEVELEERVTGHIIKASEYAVYFGCDGRCGSEWTADDCNCNKIIKYKPSPIFRFIYKAPNHSNIWLRALQQTLQH